MIYESVSHWRWRPSSPIFDGILCSKDTGLVGGDGDSKVSFMGGIHCKEISIYAFPEKELRGLSPNFPVRSTSLPAAE